MGKECQAKNNRARLRCRSGTGQELQALMQEQRSTYEEKELSWLLRVWPMRRELDQGSGRLGKCSDGPYVE
jgi:hypothetical protein